MLSWVAMDRIVEKQRAGDATYRKPSERKVLRSDAQPLGDDDLLAKLRSFGIELDRVSLERLCLKALSAEEIAAPLLDQRTFHGRQAEMESDWIWVCLTVLWQRWFPDQPSFELLDDKMQAGYALQGSGGVVAACHIWLEAWRDVLGLLDKGGLPSIHAFDQRCGNLLSRERFPAKPFQRRPVQFDAERPQLGQQVVIGERLGIRAKHLVRGLLAEGCILGALLFGEAIDSHP